MSIVPEGAPQFEFTLLDGKVHDRAAFSCGEPSLDEYLKCYAGQDMSNKLAVTHVMTVVGAPGEIAGYYALSAGSMKLSELPKPLHRKLPAYPQIGVIRLGRLALDERFQGQGLGEVVLLAALQRSRKLSTQLGAYAVVVDALHQKAGAFYEEYGFVAYPDHPRKFYLPMRLVEKLLE